MEDFRQWHSQDREGREQKHFLFKLEICSQPCVVFTPRSRMAGRSRVSEREEDPALTSFNKFVRQTFVRGLLTETRQLFGTSTPGSHAKYTIHQIHGHRQVTSFLSQFPHPENENGHPLYVQPFLRFKIIYNTCGT